MEPVAVITGANTGIGLAIARRLLAEIAPECPLRLCLACRNMEKAETARQELLSDYPEAVVDLIQVDTSRPQSAIAAAKEIREKYSCIKWLFCNAGIMPTGGVSIKGFWPPTPSHYARQLSTGKAFLSYTDYTTPDGLQAVFATNVLGHFIMVRELEEHLASQGQPCHVIWTSSNTALDVETIDVSNLQHEGGELSYPYSKRLIDLVCVGLNETLNSRGIYCFTTCPGLVVTNMTQQLLPRSVWLFVVFPLLFLIRLITNFFTYRADSGAESMVWLARQKPEKIDGSLKYFSRTTAFGRTYVKQEKISVEENSPQAIIEQLDKLTTQFTERDMRQDQKIN